jgi:penicillin amidase
VSLIALVVVVAVIVAVVGVGLVRRSFPRTSGSLDVRGLSAPVDVLRDKQGVPQIYADNALDLFRAQGYVAAQDRFFEMDLRRHITAGRLSEMVGSGGVETDKVIRTMGWRRVAEAELPHLAPATRQYLQAYADGVNAYINAMGSPSRMAFEYVVLGQQVPGYRVEQWTPVDSLSWLKAMAWDLRGNYDNELARARLAGTTSEQRLAELFPPYPYDTHQPILSARDWKPGEATAKTPARAKAGAAQAASAMPDYLRSKDVRGVYAEVSRSLAAVPVMLGRGDGIGSNSWVVAGSRTSTGKPLLANDPHLGTGIPGIWYQTGLHCRTVSAQCPFDVSGFSFSGLPGVVIGHNQRVAWGFTNLGPDVSDFYLEKVRAASYLRDGRYVPLRERPETIRVAGGKDVRITVRGTVHGPVLSDVVPNVARAGDTAPVEGKVHGGGYDVSLAWTGLRPGRTADAIFALDTAQSFPQFQAAARDFAVPAQNLVYADVDGHIGYQAPGQIPVRASSTPGTPPGYWPAPGWKSRYDWKGYVPFSQMPTTYDPPEGFLVAANQAVSTSTTPFLTTEWDYGFRSQRIRDLIEATPKVTPERMSQIQMDNRNGFAPTLVKELLRIKTDPYTQDAQKLLRTWNFTEPTGQSDQAAAGAYYNAVWSKLLDLTFNDDLTGDIQADGGGRWMEAVALLLKKPNDPWWDNKQTPGVIEGRDEILRQAMVEARRDLTKRLGKNPETWQWGNLHRLTLQHKVLGGDDVPGVVRSLFNRGPWDMPGGSSIVNANGYDASQGFAVNWAPSMRMVVDLGNLDRSRWVNQTGASGHPFSSHYDDQVGAWIEGETYPWPSTEKAVRAADPETLRLVPDRSDS